MCHVTMYSQKGESMDGPVGKCASSAPIWLVNRPNRLWPPKALTGMLLGMVQLQRQRNREGYQHRHMGQTYGCHLHASMDAVCMCRTINPPPQYDCC